VNKDIVERFVGSRIGKFVEATTLQRDTNFLSGLTSRYQYKLHIDPSAVTESELYKSLCYDVVFQAPQLKQLEHKGSVIPSRLWETLHRQYIDGEHFMGQSFNLLPTQEAQEIEAANTAAEKARLLCDYLAAQTDHSAVRLYTRLFQPNQGSISDLIS